MRLDNDDLLDRLAGDYVLGTLRGGARHRFERQLRQQPALRARVERLQRHLGSMAGMLRPESAPAHTWDRIETRLFGAASRRRGWAWRIAAAWATVASLGLMVVGGLVWLAPEQLVSTEALARRTQQVPASYMAVLSDSQGRPTLVASAARHANRMDLKVLRATAAEPGTQWVLWGHTAQGERVSLGRIDLAVRSRIELAGTAEQTLSKLATLTVTAEPERTATPSAPTRVALLQGPCVKVW